MKVLLLLLIGILLVAAIALFSAMCRRDEPILGLVGLTAALGAAFAALPYSAVDF